MDELNGFSSLSSDDSQHPNEQADGVQIRKTDGTRLETSLSPDSSSTLRDGEPPRAQWSRSIEFMLSCIGFAVGLGNVWRFPYLCYRNGGGAFLIPYAIFLVVGGIPLFFLEISLGQFMGVAGTKVWNIAPILKGLGFATTVIVFLLNCYYIVILCWDAFFLADTFAHIRQPLPWSTCGNHWNTENCKTSWFEEQCQNVTSYLFNGTLVTDVTQLMNITLHEVNTTEVCETVSFKGSDSVTEYWERRILQKSGGIDEVGDIVWQLAVSLLVVWVVCYFCIWKGVKWTGKVVYVTATFPYIIITILLIRGVTLPGAGRGIEFYLKPNITKLGDLNVWVDAGSQIFFSYAVALGALTALGSYNKYNNNCHRQVLIIALINSATSLYAGFAVFSVLGYMAYTQGDDVSVGDVVAGGPGLAFIAYPKAVSTMPVAQHLWAILFFIMIIFVGLDSQFVGVESFITTMCDFFPRRLNRPYRREIFGACYCAVSFLIGLTMVTNGGIYVFELFNYYCASGVALLWVAFFECAAVAWVYGINNYYDNLEMMLGFRLMPYFKICWLVLSPLASLTLFTCEWVQFQPLKLGKYEYPLFAQGAGICMAAASMVCIPGYAIYTMIKTKGSLKERWQIVTTPVLRNKPVIDTASDSIELGHAKTFDN